MLISSTFLVGALAIGAYAVHVDDARISETTPTHEPAEVNLTIAPEASASRLDPPSRPDPSDNPEAPADRDVSPQPNEVRPRV